ncbi:hypothetical protein AAMO2058_000010100 [Amorphochlora amoebiformis]
MEYYEISGISAIKIPQLMKWLMFIGSQENSGTNVGGPVSVHELTITSKMAPSTIVRFQGSEEGRIWSQRTTRWVRRHWDAREDALHRFRNIKTHALLRRVWRTSQGSGGFWS